MRGAAIGLIVLLAGCSQPVDPRGVRPGEVLLQVSATGRAEARPDEARLTVGVSSNAATAAAASTANNTAMNRVVTAITALGIAEDDIQTRNVTLSRIDYGRETGRYRAENLVEIRVRDVDRAGPAIAAATEAGGNVVAGPDLRVADPEAANNAAYAAAYTAARARADAYAEAAGLRVVRTLSIRDGPADGMPMPYGFAPRPVTVQAASAAPPVQTGISTREVQVQAEFALGD